jgi:hypothetical protein
LKGQETSVQNYHRTLRNTPEERRSYVHGGRSLKSRVVAVTGHDFEVLVHGGGVVLAFEISRHDKLQSTAALSYRKPASAGTSRGCCRGRGHHNGTLYQQIKNMTAAVNTKMLNYKNNKRCVVAEFSVWRQIIYRFKA